MNQQLKQRIVGAVVLVSIAIIFVPMLFEKRSELGDLSISETNIPEFPAKEFEEKVQPLPVKEEIEALAKLPEARLPVIEPVSTKKEVVKKAAVKKAAQENRPALKLTPSYIIQAGSFGKKSNAEQLARKIKKAGFPAFVKSSSEKKSVMYRVIVGPELDRKRLEKSKTRLEKRFNLKAIILKQQK